ncbi:MAG: hypothetical protein HF967_04965 [Methanosarcinales archaeon]|nr:hypothetical protein [Methanosarcinales archaeon]
MYKNKKILVIIHVRCGSKCFLKKSIEKALYDESFINIVKRNENPYYKPQSSKYIVDILKSIDVNENFIKKKFIDVL